MDIALLSTLDEKLNMELVQAAPKAYPDNINRFTSYNFVGRIIKVWGGQPKTHYDHRRWEVLNCLSPLGPRLSVSDRVLGGGISYRIYGDECRLQNDGWWCVLCNTLLSSTRSGIQIGNQTPQRRNVNVQVLVILSAAMALQDFLSTHCTPRLPHGVGVIKLSRFTPNRPMFSQKVII